jgi:hypothetical protein
MDDLTVRIGDQVLVYWRGWPHDLEHIWFHRMKLVIPILGPTEPWFVAD